MERGRRPLTFESLNSKTVSQLRTLAKKRGINERNLSHNKGEIIKDIMSTIKIAPLYIPLMTYVNTVAIGVFDKRSDAQDELTDYLFTQVTFLEHKSDIEKEFKTKIDKKKFKYIMFGNWREILQKEQSKKLSEIKDSFDDLRMFSIIVHDTPRTFAFYYFNYWNDEDLYDLIESIRLRKIGTL